MTTGLPVRKLSGHFLALLLAAGLLVPTVVLFCAVHKTADKTPTVLATGLIVRVYSSALVTATPVVSFDPNVSPSLVQEQAAQNTPAVAQNVEQQLWPDLWIPNDGYDGLSAFWGDDIVSNFFSNIGQLLAKFLQAQPQQSALIVSGFLCLWTAGPVVLSKL